MMQKCQNEGVHAFAADSAYIPRHFCTKGKNFAKVVTLHIWSDYVEMAADARYTPICQQMYREGNH